MVLDGMAFHSSEEKENLEVGLSHILESSKMQTTEAKLKFQGGSKTGDDRQ